MIGPKKKISKSKKHSRFSKWKANKTRKLLNRTNLSKCKNCWKYKISHRVCSHCSFYNWKQILTIKSKSKEKIIES